MMDHERAVPLRFSLADWAETEPRSLHRAVAGLVCSRNTRPGPEMEWTRNKMVDVIRAAEENDDGALLDLHKTLYLIYEVSFAHPLSDVVAHEFSPWLLEVRNALEDYWLKHELEEVRDLVDDHRATTAVTSHLMALAQVKTKTDRLVEDFLAQRATKEQFAHFVLSDAPLNYRFYDALVLAATHFAESVKREVSHHYWDECGLGSREDAHTWKFSTVLDRMGLIVPAVPIWEDWRPYAGYNLYFLFGFRREHYFKALGSLAMPELFDPDRDRAVVQGAERLYPDNLESFAYFYDHIEGDEEHGRSWLQHVVQPIVSRCPGSAHDFLVGGSLRMTAMRRYNEYLASCFHIDTRSDRLCQ